VATADKEERPVQRAQLAAGIKLQAGHGVELLVGGAGGGTTVSGEGSGEGGGSAEGDPTTAGP
jgi:hypothetical protein